MLKRAVSVMVSCAVLVLSLLWTQSLTQACKVEELPRGVVLSWFRERVLEGLGLEEPPVVMAQGPEGDTAHRYVRVPRTSRAAWKQPRTDLDQNTPQIIMFPTSDSSCALSDSDTNESTISFFTFYFQPSINYQDMTITSAHFWFFAGEGANASAPLFVLTSEQQLSQAPQAPSKLSSDGWIIYHLDGRLLAPVAEGPFLLQIPCQACECHTDDPGNMSFLHLHVQPRGVRSPREAAVAIPWSPSAIYLLQRPSQEKPQQVDCSREEIEISFEELGWENWIVHPKVMTFYYCHGNCSASDRAAATLGISQCCAPVPGTMRSLKVTTTSDGGYTFKYETLPNIMPEECTCL